MFAAVLAGALLFPSGGRTAGAAWPAACERSWPRQPAPRDLAVYEGLGTWVDAFDFAAAYQGGGDPAVSAAAVADMADAGVRTLYIQAARNDPRSPEGIVDRERLAAFLVAAHRHEIRVVGWYLPTFGDVDVDARNLALVADFEVLGHRFDGVAVDIEYTEAVPDHGARNQVLVELSQRLRATAGDDVLGAIVLPPCRPRW